MSIAYVNLLEARDEDRKHAVIEKLADALCAASDGPCETVRVVISETPKTQWGIGGKTAKDLGR